MEDADRAVDREAIEHMVFAAETMEESIVCPFCGMHWDNAVLRRYVAAHDFEGARGYLNEMRASPLNVSGEDWGQRAADG